MYRLIFLWFLLWLLCGPVAARSPQTWAVVIGINNYQSPAVTDLNYAVSDANLFAETLRVYLGVPEQNIFLLTSDKTGEEAPTRTNVAFRLSYLADNVGPEDTLVVFFSGHGIESQSQSYLLTQEADSRSPLTLQVSALQAKDLQSWVAATRASKLLLLVDACRNDPTRGKGDAPNVLSETMAKDLTTVALAPRTPRPDDPPIVRSSATLFACSQGQRSFEWNDKKNGFFTHFLVEGLKGQAGTAEGRVSLASLVSYLQRSVPDAAQRWALNNQIPWMRYEGPGAEAWTLAEKSTLAARGPAGGPVVVPARPPGKPGVNRSNRWSDIVALQVPTAGQSKTPTVNRTVLRVARSGGPGAFATIGEALKVAPPGSRISVSAGTYSETLFLDRPVELFGETEGVVIVTSGQHSVSSGDVLLKNVSFKDPAGPRKLGDFFAGSARPVLKDCEVLP